MPSIAVIGAGPAGSIASLILARAGINVTLIEQHRFPRDKVCGECVSALGIEVLKRHGLDAAVLQHQPAMLDRATIHSTDGDCAEFSLSRSMWGISRRVFDQLLLDAARVAGIRVLQPARCESIEPGPRPRLTVRLIESNTLEAIQPDWAIIADGKSALIPAPRGSTRDFGLKAHFTGVTAPADAIGLYGVHGHYGGVAPIEAGLWNIAFSVPHTRLKANAATVTHLDDLFANIVWENAPLNHQLRRARRVSDWLVSPLPRFPVAREWPQNIIPIGNAAAAIEPIGGEGMGLAMRSAELAAGAIVESHRSGTELDVSGLRREYRKLWALRSFACRAGAKIISSPSLARLLIPFAADIEGPAALTLRLIGK